MNKMLRRALLGGAAVAMMAAGAQAGELEALKAQLEALQTRVQTLEARGAALPQGASLITFERGSNASADPLFDNGMLNIAPASRGMTIAITPTADLPAPVATIELSGQIRTVALWHSTNDGTNNDDADLRDFDIWARGQIDVRASIDTAVGRVNGGIQVRGDMGNNASGTQGASGAPYTPDLDVRTAWFTWQMTDALSLTMGQTTQIAALSNVSYSTVATPAGLDSSRRPQIRLTYNAGPVDFRFGIEDPSAAQPTAMPDVAASMGFNAGMFGFRAGAEVGRVRNANVKKTGWIVNAGINMDLGSMVRLGIGGAYTKGLANDGLMAAGTGRGLQSVGGLQNLDGTDLVKAWAVQGNMTFTMTETTAMVLSAGYIKQTNGNATNLRTGWSVDGALVWRPVDALQFGIEGDYFSYKAGNGNKGKAAVVGVAGWFFF